MHTPFPFKAIQDAVRDEVMPKFAKVFAVSEQAADEEIRRGVQEMVEQLALSLQTKVCETRGIEPQRIASEKQRDPTDTLTSPPHPPTTKSNYISILKTESYFGPVLTLQALSTSAQGPPQ